MSGASRSYVAGEDLGSSLFVKISGVHTVSKCGAGDQADGVTCEGSREAPIPGITPVAALQGESCQVYGPGESCEVLAGAAVTAGAFVKPDANAKAVTANAADKYSAKAVNTVTAANQRLKIILVRGVA